MKDLAKLQESILTLRSFISYLKIVLERIFMSACAPKQFSKSALYFIDKIFQCVALHISKSVWVSRDPVREHVFGIYRFLIR